MTFFEYEDLKKMLSNVVITLKRYTGDLKAYAEYIGEKICGISIEYYYHPFHKNFFILVKIACAYFPAYL